MPAQRGVEIVGNVRGRSGERRGQAKDKLFLLVEICAGFKLRDVVKLLFGDSGFSADGRMNVDSKGTANHERSFELRQFLEMYGDDAFGGGVEIHAESAAEEFGVEGADAGTEWNPAEIAFHEEEDEACDGTGLAVLYALGAWHGLTSLVEM